MIKHNAPRYNSEDARLAYKVILSGRIVAGEYVEKLEQKWCEYTGAESAAMVKSGTAALRLALRALDVTLDDYVVVPKERCVCHDNAIELLSAEPSEKHYSGTTAEIVVHLFGEHHETTSSVPVIEDMSHGIFKQTAELAVSSFAPTKLIGGISGGIVSGSKELIEKIKDLRDYCDKEPNSRENDTPNEVEAVVALNKLNRLPETMKWRAIACDYYRDQISQKYNGLYRFTTSVPDAEETSEQMKAQGVCAEVPCWISDNTTLSLPLFEGITREQQDEVVRVFRGITVG